MVDFCIIGRRIKYFRKKAGLRQSDVAGFLDVSISYISQIERGVAEVSLVRLDEIANIIHANIEELIADTDEASPQFLNSELYQITKDWEPDKKNLLVKIALAIKEECYKN